MRPAPLDGTDLNDDTRFESDSDCDGEDMADMLAQRQLEREASMGIVYARYLGTRT